MVLRLDKVLYGLKQVPRAWNTACLIKLGFAQCKPEHGMHVRGTTVTQLLVGVYVDDLVIIGANSSNIDEFKLEMKTLLQMFNLRLLSYYHGIEVQQGLGRIDISESAYAQKLLEKAGMARTNPCHVPTEPRVKLSKCNMGPASDAEYSSTDGSRQEDSPVCTESIPKKKVRTKQAGPSRPELAAVQQNELGSVQWSSRPSQARGEPKKTWYVQP
jgi:hypothetical protein